MSIKFVPPYSQEVKARYPPSVRIPEAAITSQVKQDGLTESAVYSLMYLYIRSRSQFT